jgi:LCP family protein required for cell wall assembly
VRTTLKRGFGRAADVDGNGRSALPPAALTPMTRYKQPGPPPRSGWKLVLKALLWLGAVVLIFAVALVGGIYLWYHEEVVAEVQPESPGVKEAQEFLSEHVPSPGQAAIALVIGYDKRAGKERELKPRSDTVMLLRTDPDTKTISMLSFPRDLIVDVTCPGQPVYRDRINQAYSDCGEKGTLLTVQKLIGGLPINYLITVNFRGFKQIVNKLGGVWVDVDRRYFNDNSGLGPGFQYATINLQPGYQKLTGGSALNYVRYRHTDSDLFRVARQQQFVKAMKYQLAHGFGLEKALGLVRTVATNIEVGTGGKKIDGGTILSYARFAYELPAGHFFQAQIEGLTGYAELYTDPANIQTAVQVWENPDVESSKVATHVALGEKVKTATPKPEETTVTVLNGNGVAGSAGTASYLLAQRDYRIVATPNGQTGNAPRDDYFHTQVYWNPRVSRSKAAARSLAKLFAPFDVAKLPRDIRPFANGAMVTIIVGTTFKGTIAPPTLSRAPTQRQPPNVRPNPHDTAGLLRPLKKKAHFPLMVPTVLESTSYPDSEKPVRVYRIDDDGHRGVRLVFRSGTGGYWGIQEMNWEDAPILKDKSFYRNLGGRKFDLYYDGAKLHMVVLRAHGASYWVVNSLLDGLSNETMIAIAKGLKQLKGGK